MKSELLELYAVTDRAWLNGRTLASVVEEILAGGVTLLQLREKHLDNAAFLEEARVIKAVCDAHHVPLLINDNIWVARELGVGAHVGQSDASIQEARALLGPDVIIGVSCTNVAEAVRAEKAGADYLGVGAVFPTSTKLDADYVDSRELHAICRAVSIPVVAIGGISEANADQLAGSGIAGIAVVSALFAAASPFEAAQRMARQVKGMLAVPVSEQAGAIIDLDGTLLNSMPYWNRLIPDYLGTKGKTALPGISGNLNGMEFHEGAHYLKETYGLVETEDRILAEILGYVRFVYEEKAEFFPRGLEEVRRMHEAGVRLVLFTATDYDYAVAALKRGGVFEYFDRIVSTFALGLDKHNTDDFYYVLGKMGTDLKLTTIYEDSSYAIEAAEKTGMKVRTQF